MVGNALRILQLAVFSAFLAAPTAWILIFGPAAPYEQRAQTAFPTLTSMILPEGDGRDQLADSIFERSDLRRIAIGARTSLNYRVLGFADSSEVVSGAPGWLFYKPALSAWNCASLEDNRKRLEGIAIMAEMAEAANLRFLLVVAPNKATIEREKVAGRAAELARCYFTTADMVEQRLSAGNLSTVLLLAPRIRTFMPPGERYVVTDTHWRPEVAFRALGDTLARLGGPGVPDGYKPPTRATKTSTDLLLLLALPPTETLAVIDDEDAGLREILQPNTRPSAGVVVLRDSFFAMMDGIIESVFPDATVLHVLDDKTVAVTALPPADQVVVEIVERSLLGQTAPTGVLHPQGPLNQWVLDRSAAAAGQCVWDEATDLLHGAALYDVQMAPDGGAIASSSDPRIITPVVPPAAKACLEIEVEAQQPTTLQVFFANDQGEFTEERSFIRTIEPGAPTRVRAVLPPGATGRPLRVDPVGVAGAFRLTSVRLAPAPAQFAPLSPGEGAPQAPQASVGENETVVVEAGRYNEFLVVPDHGDSGVILPDGSGYQTRSTQTAREAVGDGNGVLVRLSPVAARQFSGRKVEVEIIARSSQTGGSPVLRTMYSRSGSAETSGWRDLQMTPDFEAHTFTYDVPVQPPLSFDLIAFWADSTGENLGVDIQSVKVKTID